MSLNVVQERIEFHSERFRDFSQLLRRCLLISFWHWIARNSPASPAKSSLLHCRWIRGESYSEESEGEFFRTWSCEVLHSTVISKIFFLRLEFHEFSTYFPFSASAKSKIQPFFSVGKLLARRMNLSVKLNYKFFAPWVKNSSEFSTLFADGWIDILNWSVIWVNKIFHSSNSENSHFEDWN